MSISKLVEEEVLQPDESITVEKGYILLDEDGKTIAVQGQTISNTLSHSMTVRKIRAISGG